MTLVDALGGVHEPMAPHATPRIVSLVPSITELLCDLGLAACIVGRTGFCVHPADVVCAIPKVGGTKDVQLQKVRALAPTHVIVNVDENDKAVVDRLAQFIPHVVVTHPLAPHDNLALYRLLGGIFRAEERAESLCAAFERQCAALSAAPKRAPQTVLYCIWKDPWMTVSADTYIARMLAEIGWRCAAVAPAEVRYPAFDWSAALVASIDRVLLATEPYRFNDAHAAALEQRIGKPVRVVDGELLSWYGSRAIAGLGYLRELAA